MNSAALPIKSNQASYDTCMDALLRDNEDMAINVFNGSDFIVDQAMLRVAFERQRRNFIIAITGTNRWIPDKKPAVLPPSVKEEKPAVKKPTKKTTTSLTADEIRLLEKSVSSGSHFIRGKLATMREDLMKKDIKIKKAITFAIDHSSIHMLTSCPVLLASQVQQIIDERPQVGFDYISFVSYRRANDLTRKEAKEYLRLSLVNPELAKNLITQLIAKHKETDEQRIAKLLMKANNLSLLRWFNTVSSVGEYMDEIDAFPNECGAYLDAMTGLPSAYAVEHDYPEMINSHDATKKKFVPYLNSLKPTLKDIYDSLKN